MGLWGKAKGFAKSYIKTILKGYVLKIIIIVAAAVLLLALFWYAIGHGTISTVSKVVREGDINTNVQIVSDENGNYKYKIDEDLIKRINEALKNMAINNSSIELTDELLEKFYEAEIITSFPDLRKRNQIGTEVPEGELQGCIVFTRKYEDGTEEPLEYMNFKDFQEKIGYFGYKLEDSQGNSPNIEQGSIYTDKSTVEAKYNNLRRFFTLDEENNLIIATMSSTETKITYNDWAKKEEKEDDYKYTYNVDIKRINYQLQTKKYSMPIEYLLSMLVVSENGKFCEAITDLVRESKIVIDIHDDLTTTYTEERYDYVSRFYLNKIVNYTYETGGGTYTNPETGEVVEIESETENYTSNMSGTYIKYRHMDNLYDSYKTTETTVKQYQTQLCIAEAKTWLLETTLEFQISNNTTTSSETIGATYTGNIENQLINSTSNDLSEYVTVQDYHNLLSLLEDDDLPSGAVIDTNRPGSSTIKERKNENEETTIVNTKITSVTYDKISSQITPQEEKFLSLLKVDPDNIDEKGNKIFNKEDIIKNKELIIYTNDNGKKSSPDDNIMSSEQVLFSYLSSFEESQAFEEIMRYLLYIYTGHSYGVTELDFSIYEAGDFTAVSDKIYGGTIQEKVWFALKDLGYTDIVVAGAMGNIDYESGGFSASAVEKGSGNGIGLIQWSFGRRISLENYASSKGVSWTDENTQIEFLIAEISGKGPASGYATRRTSGYIKSEGKAYTATASDWENATSIENATLAFMRFFESPANKSSYTERCDRARKYYNEFQGKQKSTEITEESANLIVAWAEQQVGKSSFYNKYSARTIISKGYCAAFAKSAHYEAGLEYPDGNAIDISHPNVISYDSKGKVDWSKIPIGAYIVSKGTSIYGHVALYVGNGYVIEAGGNRIVKQLIDDSYGKGKFLGWGT